MNLQRFIVGTFTVTGIGSILLGLSLSGHFGEPKFILLVLVGVAILLSGVAIDLLDV